MPFLALTRSSLRLCDEKTHRFSRDLLMAVEACGSERCLHIDNPVSVKCRVGYRSTNSASAACVGVTELALVVGASRPLVPVIAAVPGVGTTRPVSRRIAVAGSTSPQPRCIPGRCRKGVATVGHRVQNRLAIAAGEIVAERTSRNAVAGDARARLSCCIEARKRVARNDRRTINVKTENPANSVA